MVPVEWFILYMMVGLAPVVLIAWGEWNIMKK
jgi:hypothetical protein